MRSDNGFDWDKSSTMPRRGTKKLGRRGYGSMPRSPAETLEPMRAVEPPIIHRKKREYHKTLVFMSGTITTLIFLIIAVGAAVGVAKYMFDKPGPLATSDIIVIPKGEGLNAIASRLERKNIIDDKRLFKVAVMYFEAQNKLKAGEYDIQKNASMRQVLDRLLEGKSLMYSLPFPEGLTSQQVVERLNANQALKGEVLETPPEGSLLPDTYKFTRGTDRTELIKRMQTAQVKFLDNIWETRKPNNSIETKEQALILASIVEKETGIASERPLIAGVFLNRLEKGIRLQSDPTIIYGLIGGTGKLGRGLRRSEIDRKTPYNTYQIDGLPPTPIANPGRAAIEAVLNPKATSHIYFVADGTGGHIFARTLKEHENNVRNWRKIEAKRKIEAEILAKQKALNPESAADISKDETAKEETIKRGEDKQSNQDIFENLTATGEEAVTLDVADEPSAKSIEAINKIPLPQKK